MYEEPITITSQTITIAITFPLLLHLVLLLMMMNQRNTTQTDYKIVCKDRYYLRCITHNHKHIITDNIVIKLN